MRHRPFLLFAAAITIAAGAVSAPARPDARPELAFQISEGRNLNALVREGPVAAHLLLRSGMDPRILVAFPAGNSGVGLWFAKATRPVAWSLEAPPRPVSLADRRGRPLHGIVAEATVDVGRLDVRQAALSSVRVLRDFELGGGVPADVIAAPRIEGNAIVWERDRLDGAPGYRLRVEVLNGRASPTAITAGGTKMRLRITALSGEAPLHGLEGERLLNGQAGNAPRLRDTLSFLSYREKFLAGSWRFNTYFGRDTMMATRLLMPALQPEAVESGIGAVLERLSPGGEVAHEEDIGEFAILRHRAEDGTDSAAPLYDYKMIDDDFMLPVVAQDWLLDDPRGIARATAFLASKGPDGEARGAALVRNFRFVVDRTAAFAADPSPTNLVGLKDNQRAGQWRDSDEGLARGRYPYDVNVVWIPAALGAIGRFVASGLLTPYMMAETRAELARAATARPIWQAKAPSLFEVTLSHEAAATDIANYAASLGVDATAALVAIGTAPVRFNALSLDAEGRPIPVMHSDDGFLLMFGYPDEDALARSLNAMARPFPAGLMTDAGMVVANPVHADPQTRERLSNGAYHGTVVWSWQQAMFAAGLARQLARTDLSPDIRARLADTQTRLWRVIARTDALSASELWTWRHDKGSYQPAPFGARGSDEDESNAVQLWSSAFLALRPPKELAR